jgi:uracil-DNA glycosylase family 4
MDVLAMLRREIVACTRCRDLRAYCADIARRGKPEFAGQTYWGKPVPPLGEASAAVLIVGLAPAAHGGNRTGRMFTGDGSADWLARALFASGFATQPTSRARGDGFALKDAYLSAAIRCAPPKNKPSPRHIANCASYLRAEFDALRKVSVVVALGKIAFDRSLRLLADAGYEIPRPRPAFAHSATTSLSRRGGKPSLTLIGSFHPSRQNTNTGKLTQQMLDAVFAKVRTLI